MRVIFTELRKVVIMVFCLITKHSMSAEVNLVLDRFYLGKQYASSLQKISFLNERYSDLKVIGYAEMVSIFKKDLKGQSNDLRICYSVFEVWHYR